MRWSLNSAPSVSTALILIKYAHLGLSVSLTAYHATGASDVFYARNVSICQAAAGLLIASEAGASVKQNRSGDIMIDRIMSTLSAKS